MPDNNLADELGRLADRVRVMEEENTRLRTELDRYQTVIQQLAAADVPTQKPKRQVRVAKPPTNNDDRSVTLNVPAVAKHLGVSPRTVWNLIKQDSLPSVTIGSRRFVTREALDKYLRDQQRQNTKRKRTR